MNTQPDLRPRRFWTEDEDNKLLEEVKKQERSGGVKDWRSVAQKLPQRNNRDCRKRWLKLDGSLNKGPWSKEEDQRLYDACLSTINNELVYSWTEVSRSVGTRNPDQCAKRWQHFLDPELNYSEWTPHEDQLLLEEVEKNGRNWARIGDCTLRGRSATDAKNRYNLLQRNRNQAPKSCSDSPGLNSRQTVAAHVPRNNESNTDILGFGTVDSLKSGDWSTDFPGLLEGVHNPMLFSVEQTCQPKQIDQFGPLEDTNFAASMFSPWLSNVPELDMAASQSATPMTAFTSALSAGSVSRHDSSISDVPLNQYATLSTRCPKTDEVDEDDEDSDSGEDTDTAQPTECTGSRKSSVTSHRDKRRKTVNMELRGVEPEQVQKILSCLLSSDPTVDVKISRSSTA